MVAAAASYAVVALCALHWHWGVIGVWSGFEVFMLVRLVTCAARYRSGRWLVLGAESPA